MGITSAILRMFSPATKALDGPADDHPLVRSDILGVRASSGTDISHGRIRGYETNPEFSAPGSWAIKADEMLRVCSRARALDRVLRHALKSVEWRATPGGGSPEAIRNAAFTNEAMGWAGETGRMDATWEEFIDRISHFARVGFRTAEERYKIERWAETGNLQVWLESYFDMEPSSIRYWITSPETGELEYVQQYQWTQSEPAPRPVPSRKMILVNLDQTGRNYEGIGLFRSMYIWYVFLGFLIDHSMVRIERWAVGTPKVTTKRSASAPADAGSMPVYEDGQTNQIIDDTVAMASAYRVGSTGVVVDSEVAELSIFGEGAISGLGDLLDAMRHADKEMSTLYLAGWLELGVDATGSRAVGEVHHGAFRTAVVNLADNIKNKIGGRSRPGGGTVDRLLRMNFYGARQVPTHEMPIISHSGLKADALADAVPQLAALVSSGALPPTRAMWRRLSALLDIPFDEEALEAQTGITRADLDAVVSRVEQLADMVESDGQVEGQEDAAV